MQFFSQDMDQNKRMLYHALVVPVIIVILLCLVFALEYLGGYDFHSLGVYPREFKGMIGILTMPFIHGDAKHLYANIIPIFVLTLFLYMAYRPNAHKVLIFVWIFTGVILWIIGRSSWHIGVSGIIYGLVCYLFFGGLAGNNRTSIAVALIVAFLYGGIIWYMIPIGIDNHISWEGHLSGAISGIIAAIIFRTKPNDDENSEKQEDEQDDVQYDWRDSDRTESELPS
ncbi:MAG: rhomboid family intramembrane serine protease [Bacteroidia bacterium]|nr:rhomboid family intramembrane serine protease [Bacteroidia bacterium]